MKNELKPSFSLAIAQKKGNANVNKTVEWVIGALIVAVLVATLSGSIFTYFGTGATGLGNVSANPSVPSWLPTTLIIAVAVGLLVLVFKAMGLLKDK